MCMFSERTQVLLSPRQVEKLKRIAARQGSSVGAVIRDAIDSYVDPGPIRGSGQSTPCWR